MMNDNTLKNLYDVCAILEYNTERTEILEKLIKKIILEEPESLNVKEELKKIGGTYSSGTQPREVLLKTGFITAKDVTDGTTVLESDVKFIVADALKQGETVTLDEGEHPKVTTKRDVKVSLVVCGDPAAEGGSAQYIVSIAPERQGLAASQACLEALQGGR